MENYWVSLGRPDSWDWNQAHDSFREHMCIGHVDEVNAVHTAAGRRWPAIEDMVQPYAQAAGISGEAWARMAEPLRVGDL